jgi:L-amino acid N-acyltransferase
MAIESLSILAHDQRGLAMLIRDGVEADFEQITAIYNEVLTNSTAIYNDRPASVEERISWGRSRLAQGYPVLVAADGAEIAGFATFGDFRAWPGYRFTVEGTVHVRSGGRGQGVGTELLKAILARAKAAGKHIMIAGVDSENAASLRFLERSGFERAGCLREVGYKFNRYLDLVFMQYWITPPTRPTKS